MSQEAMQRAIDIVGSNAKLARAVGATPAQVTNWLRREKRAAARYCVRIEKATDGKVTCHELRPDIFPAPPVPPDDCESISTLPP